MKNLSRTFLTHTNNRNTNFLTFISCREISYIGSSKHISSKTDLTYLIKNGLATQKDHEIFVWGIYEDMPTQQKIDLSFKIGSVLATHGIYPKKIAVISNVDATDEYYMEKLEKELRNKGMDTDEIAKALGITVTKDIDGYPPLKTGEKPTLEMNLHNQELWCKFFKNTSKFGKIAIGILNNLKPSVVGCETSHYDTVFDLLRSHFPEITMERRISTNSFGSIEYTTDGKEKELTESGNMYKHAFVLKPEDLESRHEVKEEVEPTLISRQFETATYLQGEINMSESKNE